MSTELIFDIFDNRPIEEDTIILDTIGAYYDDIRILMENVSGKMLQRSNAIT